MSFVEEVKFEYSAPSTSSGYLSAEDYLSSPGQNVTSSLDGRPSSLSPPVADCIRQSFLTDIKNHTLGSTENLLDHNTKIMTSTTSVKEWSSPEKTKISGVAPGPDQKIAQTARGELRRQDVQMITPMYKTDRGSVLPNGGTSMHIKRETRLEPQSLNGAPDYRVEKEQESYRLHIIDPKSDVTHSSITNTLPAYLRKRNKTPDFPSAHTKRSLLKVDPLEPRRLKSLETKVITPRDYLAESLDRHRAVSMSPLRENLKVKERDVNQPWDPAAHPGHKREDTVNRAPKALPSFHQSLPSLIVSPVERKVTVREMQRNYLSEVTERQRMVTSSEEIHRVLEEEQLHRHPWPRDRYQETPPYLGFRESVSPRFMSPQARSESVISVQPLELSVRDRARHYDHVIRHEDPNISPTRSWRPSSEGPSSTQHEPRRLTKTIIRPNVFEGDDEYLRHLEKQYQMSRSLERQSKSNGLRDAPLLNRTVSETHLNGASVPSDRIKKSYKAQLEYELKTDPADGYVESEEYYVEEESRDSSYSPYQHKPTVPPVKKKILRKQSHDSTTMQQLLNKYNQSYSNNSAYSNNTQYSNAASLDSLHTVDRQAQAPQTSKLARGSSLNSLDEIDGRRKKYPQTKIEIFTAYPLRKRDSVRDDNNGDKDNVELDSQRMFSRKEIANGYFSQENISQQFNTLSVEKGDVFKASSSADQNMSRIDISPQKIVFENEPVSIPVDARYGSEPDYVTSKVRQLRDLFTDKINNEELQRLEKPRTRWEFQALPQGLDPYHQPPSVVSPVLEPTYRVPSTSEYSSKETYSSSTQYEYRNVATEDKKQQQPRQTIIKTTQQPSPKLLVDRAAQTAAEVPQEKPPTSTQMTFDSRMYIEQQKREDQMRNDELLHREKLRLQQQQLEIERQRMLLEEKRKQEELRLMQEKQQLDQQRAEMQMHEQRRRDELALVEQQMMLEQQKRQLREEQARLQEMQKPKPPPVPPPTAPKPQVLRPQPELPEMTSPGVITQQNEPVSPGSWRRIYFVEPTEDVIRNRITSSNELLNEERYDIDWWQRRNAFLPKREHPPEVRYVGKVWQPPPDNPAPLPGRKGLPKEFVPLDDKEYKWEPYLMEPEFKYEHKNFTPVPSPPPTQKTFTSTPIPQEQLRFGPLSPVQPRIQQQSPRSPNVDVRMRVLQPPPSSRTQTSSLSSLAFSEPNLPRVKSPPGGTLPLENEPTPRHPSTITVTDKPRVNIRSKIEAFEPSSPVETGRLPRREFGTYATRQYALQNSGPYEGDTRVVRKQQKSKNVYASQPLAISMPDERHGDPRVMHMMPPVGMGRYRTQQPAGLLTASKPSSQNKVLDEKSRRRVTSEVDLTRIQLTTTKKEIIEDLAELAARREQLLNRSKNRSALNIRELRKVDPNYLDLPERELYEDSYDTKVEQHISYKGYGRSHSALGTEWDTSERHGSKSRSQTNLASWQFSDANFSPRSVISVNGHQDDAGLLRIRTDLSPAQKPPVVYKSNAAIQTHTTTTEATQQQPQFWPFPAVLVPLGGAQTSTIVREVKEEKRIPRDFDRYSEDDNDSKQSTLIKIKDESGARKPTKSIMKQQRSKEIVTVDNWETENVRPRRIVEENQLQVQQVVPKVTETVSTVEETKRTEEVERRVKAQEKKEKKEKRKKKGESRERRHISHHSSSSHHGTSSQHGPRPGAIDYPPWTVPFGEYVVQSTKMVQVGERASSSAQTDLVPYVRESQQSPWRQPAIVHNGHVQNGQGYDPNYPTINERYQRQTTTKRVQDNLSDIGSRQATKLSEYRGGRENGHAMNGGGDSREGYRYNQSRERVHKSHSSNNVFHNELPEDFGDPKPIVEFPPTLQRGDDRYHQQQSRNMHKTRSTGDWQMEPRYGRRWEADISGAERDFRDSLLMPAPAPGQNINEREYREEVIPGGHETFSRETKANSGSRNESNGTTHFSHSKNDVSFKREQATDRRY